MIYLNLFGGILLLLYGIKMVNDGLQQAAGSKIRSLLHSLTSNRLTAVGTGAFITGLIQSSSATSVMLVGFVSAGLMSFRQSLAVILGADIGTTITVQLIAFRVYDYAIILIGAGLAFIFFTKRHLYKNIGYGLLGFGFVFLSLKLMSDAMAPLRESDLFRQVLIALVGTPFMGILLAAALTALIQSSAATLGIALALAVHGLIPLDAAIYIIFGANIGTCSTAVLASLRSPVDARRVAWAHVLFKVAGVALFLPFFPYFSRLVQLTASDLSRQIANAHTLFSVIISVVFLPATGLFALLVTKLVPEKEEEKKFGPRYLDKHVIGTPSLALGQAAREVLRTSDIVRDMLFNAIKGLQSSEPSLITTIKEKDNLVDILDREIRLYLTRLSSTSLTEQQSSRAVALLEITRDLENIGDIVDRNIMSLAMKRINKGLKFSDQGMEEIASFHAKVVENFDMAVSAFAGNDRDLADRVLRNKEELATLERDLVQAHIERLRKELKESIETSHIHLDIIGNLARINALITHTVYAIVEERQGSGQEKPAFEQ